MSVVRGASLRARLTRTLVGLGLVSVLLLAAVNFAVVRGLLDRGVRDQLTTLRDLRSQSIDVSGDRLLTRVAVLGADAGLADALDELAGSYRAIDVELDDAQVARLEDTYAEVVGPYDEAGVERPPVADLVPGSVPGRYVQYHYIADNPFPQGERGELIDAGDGSAYSAAHARHHPFLRDLAATVGASDLVLVDSESGDVVYSVEKLVDLGTDVEAGPHADTGLGRTWASLGQAAVTEAVVADSAFYLPDEARPLVHVAASVRDGSEVIGAVIVTIDIGVLTTMVTADQQWDQLGLGDTGDAYLVGADLRLRTVPRPWFESPADYLEAFRAGGGDERIAELMEFTGSPVLLQTVDNDAVRSALAGDEFVGTVDNHLGEDTLAASASVTIGDLGWVIVTEQETGEARDELERFAVSILILLAVLLPILALVGTVLARVLARPVRPLVDAAGRIADGDYRTSIPDLGHTELGDVGRQLEAVASELRSQEDSIAAEERRITTMLGSVLPPSLVEPVRRGDRNIADVADTGTVIAITVDGLPELANADQDALVELSTRVAEEAAGVVADFGIERIRVAPEQLLFVSGRGMPQYACTEAVTFAAASTELIRRVGADLGLTLTTRAGVAAGLVATGLLGSHQVAFGAWGESVARAIDLSRLAGADEILGDLTVLDELDESWDAEPVTDLDGEVYRLSPRAAVPVSGDLP